MERTSTAISPEVWKQRFRGLGAYRMAEVIISDLIGYRSTSLRRADDTTNLTHALTAVIEMTLAHERAQVAATGGAVR